MQRILVTGATGFVGRRLCRALLDRGNDVIAAVRNPAVNNALPTGVEFYAAGDIGPDTSWNKGVLKSVDTVVHLAARVHIMNDTAKDPAAEFRKVNIAGTEGLIRAAAASARRFVYVSSLHAMRTLTDELLTEESECAPESDYGKSKLWAEQVVREVGEETGIETVILRPPPVYGPGNLGNLLRLFDAVRKGRSLPLGLVKNRRSLIYVENLVDALAACVHHENAANQTFLVSDGRPVSIGELVRETGTAFGLRAKLWPVPVSLMKLGGKLTGQSETVSRLVESSVAVSSVFEVAERDATHPEGRMKRVFDILFSLTLIVLGAIPLAMIALAVKLTSKGPALYWSDRVGRHNAIFSMPKFRTMRVDTPQLASHLLMDPNQWLTPIGNILRRTSLDELPQLWSVLKGDMSFVGPRPALFNQDDLVELRTREGVHELPVGVTGWAQVNGRDESPIPQKVAFDVEYLNNRSLWFDLKVIAITVVKVVRREGTVVPPDVEKQTDAVDHDSIAMPESTPFLHPDKHAAISRRDATKLLIAGACGMNLLSVPAFAAEGPAVDWLAEVQKPPRKIPRKNIGRLEPLRVGDDGKPIRTLAEWKQRRKSIRDAWLKFLGPMPTKRPANTFQVLRTDKLEHCTRQLVRYEGEPGIPVEGYLLRPLPDGDKPKQWPGIVALHQTTRNSIDEIAGVTGNESQHLGLKLAQRGFVVFCPRCFLWQNAKNYNAAVAQFRQRHPKTLGMHKMLYDAIRGVDLLADLPDVDASRIGATGHSLGGKETLYLAAFDERIKAAVASEGGVGFQSTNWDAPWYLGKGIHEKDFPLNHHQLIALIAPRAFLILGGEKGRGAADGDRTWPFVEAALPVYDLYGKPRRLGLLNHRQGHSIPPKVFERLTEWLRVSLAKR
eukprot:g8447.t1